MERIEIAALSKIADILSDNNKSPIIPESVNDCVKRQAGKKI